MKSILWVGIAAALFGLTTGCGSSSKERRSVRSSGKGPTTSSKAAASAKPVIAALLEQHTAEVTTVAESINQMNDRASAGKAAAQFKKSAETIRELTAKVKAQGKITKEENKQLNKEINDIADAGAKYSRALKHYKEFVQQSKLPAETRRALELGLLEFGTAEQEWSNAVRAAAP